GIVLGAAGLVRSYRRSFFGPVTKNIVAEAEDLKRREIVVIGAMCLLIFLLGFYPGLVLETSRLASEAWLQQLGLGPVNQ
ncbi:MAG: NADH-quinone oxidoreductase subunit M, partial [Gammaproteobacteria bacterium]|nr:NADH-quinone oxidoreductase subunit M [Gammaproteobacteria bacterium]